MPLHSNSLFYGDNLEVLRNHEDFPSESVDLIYLDPPFNSKRDYNVLYKTPAGHESDSQITAFEDSWHWGEQAELEFSELVRQPNTELSELIQALRRFLKETDMMAYLTMMANRLLEMHRVLKPTGSLYLHCDPTASHYLKIVLDGAFGKENFRSEIIWRRTNAHNKLSQKFGPIHDTILFYAKSDAAIFYPGRRPYAKDYISQYFPYKDEKGNYQSNVLTGAGVRTGSSGKQWHQYNPTLKGRHWAIPSKLLLELPLQDQEKSITEILDRLDHLGLVLHPKGESSLPRYKQYLGSSEGILYQDIWAYQPNTRGLLYGTEEGIDEDVKWIDDEKEKLGYPTQKPVGLLNRIISSSSNEGGRCSRSLLRMRDCCPCGAKAEQKMDRDRHYPPGNLSDRKKDEGRFSRNPLRGPRCSQRL